MRRNGLHEYIFFFAGLILTVFLVSVSFYASQTQRAINSKAAYETATPNTSPTFNPQSPTPTTSPYVNLACYGCIASGVGGHSCNTIIVTTGSGNTCESAGFYSSYDACAGNCGPDYYCLPEGGRCGFPFDYNCCHGSCINWHCRSAVPPTPGTCSAAGVPCSSNNECCSGLQCLTTLIGKVCN